MIYLLREIHEDSEHRRDDAGALSERIGFEIKGIEIITRLYYARAVLDWHGLTKNGGA